MNIAKRDSAIISVVLAVCALQVSLMPAPACAGAMSAKEVAQKWNKLKGKHWTRHDMQLALKLSDAESLLFDTLAQLKRKQKLSWGAIVTTMKVCEQRPGAMKEFWSYVKTYGFHPREVAEVFRKLPPSETHRWYYFVWRSGGPQGYMQRGKAGKDTKKKTRKHSEGYSKNEVLGIFQRAEYDVKLIEKYFEKRKAGISIKAAWADVREEVLARQRKRQKKKAEKIKQKRQRREERKRKLEKLETFRKKQQQARQDSDDKEEKVKTTTLQNLLGGDSDSEDNAEKKAGDTENKKEDKQPAETGEDYEGA